MEDDRKQKIRMYIYPIVFAAKNCIENRRILPALILIYSGIDIMGWLSSDEEKPKPKKGFTNWVDQYLFKACDLNCTAIELYSARCGVLHTLTPYSDLTREKNVRKISYAWGECKASTLMEKVHTKVKSDDIVPIQLEQLLDALDSGISLFLNELDKDASKAKKVYKKADQFFVTLSSSIMDSIIQIFEQEKSGFKS
jgi:hypothetical protein